MCLRSTQPGFKEKIVEVAFNNSSVRDMGRVLNVAEANIDLICEVDGKWSFLGNKKSRSWLLYA
ncbi:IS1-like element transposase [Vibrio alfacsensis]|uniref:IS1-like element transposase n=1 Tax=Vibrio alfacsensis TaxID=1074311 RepID=UPI004068AB01